MLDRVSLERKTMALTNAPTIEVNWVNQQQKKYSLAFGFGADIVKNLAREFSFTDYKRMRNRVSRERKKFYLHTPLGIE
jgi:hypothetical protein